MPNVLPTIPNDPPQGIQALLDKVYLWNPDVSNELIEKINALLAKLGDSIGVIRPYNEMVAPINQYEPCYYGDGVYVAARELTEVPAEFNEEDWILIARKEITADKIHINFAGQDDTVQNAIDTLKTDQGELGDQVSGLEEKIPESASSTNQLVTKNELSDYLPTTGGAVDGDIRFNGVGASFASDATGLQKARVTWGAGGLEVQTGEFGTQRYHLNSTNFFADGGITLGVSAVPWVMAYIQKLNNGADLIVPTEGGTLARVEDINAAVGDISTALTAILGE